MWEEDLSTEYLPRGWKMWVMCHERVSKFLFMISDTWNMICDFSVYGIFQVMELADEYYLEYLPLFDHSVTIQLTHITELVVDQCVAPTSSLSGPEPVHNHINNSYLRNCSYYKISISLHITRRHKNSSLLKHHTEYYLELQSFLSTLHLGSVILVNSWPCCRWDGELPN